jgi:DNA-binding response OmpR family regulator
MKCKRGAASFGKRTDCTAGQAGPGKANKPIHQPEIEESMKKHTLLVVDDDKDLAQSVNAYLTARGYEVVTATNGTEAIAWLNEHQPDLIVLDVMMDYEAEGLNLAYKLHCDERTRKIPIVILSGFLKQLDTQYDKFEFLLGRDWPAAKMFEKPVKLAELADSIAALLRESENLQRVLAEAEAG